MVCADLKLFRTLRFPIPGKESWHCRSRLICLMRELQLILVMHQAVLVVTVWVSMHLALVCFIEHYQQHMHDLHLKITQFALLTH